MFKDNLKRFRKSQGLSQQQLADKLHVVRQTISKWESGSSVPDANLLLAISDVLAVDANALLGEAADPAEALRPAQELAVQQALNAQHAANFARYRRWTKMGFALMAIVCIGLLLAATLFARDFFRLYDGAQNGYQLQGTYEQPMENLGDGHWLLGARLSFADKADDGFDGFWQLSGFWDGGPMTGTTLEIDGIEYGIQFDYEREDAVINGGFVRTEDPNVVILQDQDHNEVGWASVAYTLGNHNEQGLLYAEYQGISLQLPKKMEEVTHYAQSIHTSNQLHVYAPAGVEDGVTAETWFAPDEKRRG